MESIERARKKATEDVDKARKKTKEFFQYDVSNPNDDFDFVPAEKPLEKYFGIDKLQKTMGITDSSSSTSNELQRREFLSEGEQKFSMSDNRLHENNIRLFNRDGTINVQRKQMTFNKLLYQLKDPFHTLLNTSWKRIILYIWTYYIIIWLIFGVIYYICPGICLGKAENASQITFVDAFLFSVETQTTIGFGNIWPSHWYTNTTFIVQCLVGVVMNACLLGVIYAKFANPGARSSSILFSQTALIAKRDGKLRLMFRISNMRKHQMMQAMVKLYLSRECETAEGEQYMKFELLPVNNDDLLMFSGFPFLVIHTIDEKSPLCGMSSFNNQHEIIVLYEATDTATANLIQVRYSYTSTEIAFGGRYTPIVERLESGALAINYGRYHDVETDDIPNKEIK